MPKLSFLFYIYIYITERGGLIKLQIRDAKLIISSKSAGKRKKKKSLKEEALSSEFIKHTIRQEKINVTRKCEGAPVITRKEHVMEQSKKRHRSAC